MAASYEIDDSSGPLSNQAMRLSCSAANSYRLAEEGNEETGKGVGREMGNQVVDCGVVTPLDGPKLEEISLVQV